MSSSALAAGIRQLQSTMAVRQHREDSDEQLLHAFTTQRNEAAFAVLVRRHGPMALHVCRRVLGHEQDAEDAFQATFLVLACHAATLRNQSSLVSFLHGTAYRTAMKAKQTAARRRKHEGLAPSRTPADPADELSWREARALLDEEIDRLPEKYRSVFVLFHLEDLSREETARRLGVTDAAVAKRLAEARKRLAQRLTRRGVELTAVLAVAAMATPPASALPIALMAATIKAALAMAAGEELASVVSASVAKLVKSATAAMITSKAKIATILFLTVTLLAGAGAWTCHALVATQMSNSPPTGAKANGPSYPASDKVEKREMMSVKGQVLDPGGKPLAGTQVTVLAETHRLQRHGGLSREQKVIGHGETDREGKFSLMAPRTSSLRNLAVDVLAAHAGYGLGWQSFDADAPQPTVVVRLHPEQILHGRLIDLQGKPVIGAKLHVVYIRKEGASIALDGLRHMGFVWPKPIDTDKNGRFSIRRIGSGAAVSFCTEHEHCAPERLELSSGETKTFVLTPARLLEGRVLYADTGKPAAHVEVGTWGVRGETDEQGRFGLNPSRGPIREQEEIGLVTAYAPEGEPYLHAQKSFRWPKASMKHRIDLALPHGVMVHGRVAEKDSGKPVAGALVFYGAQNNNPNIKRGETGFFDGLATGSNAVTNKHDGTFQIACLPGAGYLAIEGPGPDYVLAENGGYDRLFFGKHGGQPWLSHGFAAVDLQLGVKPLAVVVALRKGVTFKATVGGPAGQPVGDLQAFCRLEGFAASPVKIRGSCVELHGCDAENKLRVMVFDAKNKWGLTVEMSKQNAGEKPMPIRLAPCGAVRVRFLNAEGKPLAKYYPGLFLELAPKHGDLRAQTYQVLGPFDKSGPHTDEQGWCTVTELIPGATYWFGHAKIETAFIAKTGEVLKLPDVLMKPQP